jgi:uncharacterized phiE125 gp8 family phage protein
MSIIFNRSITVSGIATNADVVPTIAIIRTDTSATVVATTSTGITNPSTGSYSYTLSDTVEGVTYRATWTFIVNGKSITTSSEVTEATGIEGEQPLEKLVVVTPPAANPVTYGDAMNHMRATSSQVASQAQVESWISAATAHAERFTGMSLMPRVYLASFFDNEPLMLPRGPILEVQSVYDDDGHTTTDFELQHYGKTSRVKLGSTANLSYPIRIQYQAGYVNAASVPADMKLGILQHVATIYENRESVSDKAMVEIPHSLKDFYRLNRRGTGIG